MRRKGTLARVGAYWCVLALAAYPTPLTAATGCPDPWHDGPGWASHSVVTYNLSYLPAGDVRNAAQEAINRWNAANQNNNSHVVFAPGGNQLMFMQNALQNSVAGTNANSRNSTTNAVEAAQIFIDLSHTVEGPDGITYVLQPNEPGYYDALVGIFMHEMGHLMGLEDVDVPDPGDWYNCAGQTRGNSVMNAFCGVNNQGWDYLGGSQATDVTGCDASRVQTNYPVTTVEDYVQEYSGYNGSEYCYQTWNVTQHYYWDGTAYQYEYTTYNYIWREDCYPYPPV